MPKGQIRDSGLSLQLGGLKRVLGKKLHVKLHHMRKVCNSFVGSLFGISGKTGRQTSHLNSTQR